MAFLFPAPDARVHRLDDDYLSSNTRGPQRGRQGNPHDGSLTPGQLELQPSAQLSDGAAETVRPAFQQLPPVQRKHLVLADPFAFRYLEDDICVTVVERRTVLRGYESYLVEQWACSRQSPTVVITTYTGDQRHSILAGILSVPADENLWPVKLRMYFKAIHKFHARPKETVLGELMVTNLSSFPSALTVILVPGGDIKKYRQTFIINEDLKRLGCSGRSGLTLNDPAEATQAKFQQLYKTSDRVPLSQAVMELIKLCQVALFMFEKLQHEYIDGLLCDMTETAINNWWIEVGAEHYNFEPTDGILGPSTVAALLGMFMGARNRLHWYGAPVTKDVFDIDSTKRGIGHFQKSQKLEKTRRLDRQTLLRLYSASAKAAASEGWGVQRAVKSTVTEIGGKRGELVMGMVSGKDKGGIADIETVDIDRFVSLAYGERPKWLWHGKPRRTPADIPNRTPELGTAMVWKDEVPLANPKRLNTGSVEEEPEVKPADDSPGIYSAYPPGSTLSVGRTPGDKDALPKQMFKSVAGKVSDARSGFGRIKDVVGGGLRGHNARPSISTKDDYGEIVGPSTAVTNPAYFATAPPMGGINRAFTWKNKPEEYLAAMRRGEMDVIPGLPQTGHFASTSTVDIRTGSAPDSERRTEEGTFGDIGAEVRRDVLSKAPSAVGSLAEEAGLQGQLLEVEVLARTGQLGLARRHSIAFVGEPRRRVLNENRWPRRVSFSDAEEAVLPWEQIIDIEDGAGDLGSLEAYAEIARHFNDDIGSIKNGIEPWVAEKLKDIEQLNERYDGDREELQALYEQLNEACQRLRVSADEVLAEERSHLTEGLKEVEVLVARLDYEINALLSKVVDVEDGIVLFERQVEDMEERADALQVQLETEGWLHWAFRTLTGIGTGPDITRSAP
ncbi:hypothetical protein B0T10DRAFT_470297 [Thelonectria olida]|uniref:STB6-like N-terminal domain-containing protein n=1 Tax=Thelonectria olida TaxID=1576542 RepID=A0A9P8WGL3_9HYPO|nr:hypothetical protein B0T10DRAFT_470297 [Thelonectria olida]